MKKKQKTAPGLLAATVTTSDGWKYRTTKRDAERIRKQRAKAAAEFTAHRVTFTDTAKDNIRDAMNNAYTKKPTPEARQKIAAKFCIDCETILTRYNMKQARARSVSGQEPRDQKHMAENVRRHAGSLLKLLEEMQSGTSAEWNQINKTIQADWMRQHSQTLAEAHSAALRLNWWKQGHADMLTLAELLNQSENDDRENQAYDEADTDFDNVLAAMTSTLQRLSKERSTVGRDPFDLREVQLWRTIARIAARICGIPSTANKHLESVCKAVADAAGMSWSIVLFRKAVR
jgi:hypothetical protein